MSVPSNFQNSSTIGPPPGQRGFTPNAAVRADSRPTKRYSTQRQRGGAQDSSTGPQQQQQQHYPRPGGPPPPQRMQQHQQQQQAMRAVAPQQGNRMPRQQQPPQHQPQPNRAPFFRPQGKGWLSTEVSLFFLLTFCS